MSEAAPQRHPLDYDALRKGDIIQTDVIVAWVKCTPADGSKWNFGMLRVKDAVEAERTDLIARIDGDTVRILLDAEADQYLDERVRVAVASLGNVVRKRPRIDRESLSAAERQLAESRDRIAQATYFAATKARDRQLQIAGFVRPAAVVTAGDDEAE
jgi:hypothetical protein